MSEAFTLVLQALTEARTRLTELTENLYGADNTERIRKVRSALRAAEDHIADARYQINRAAWWWEPRP